MSENCLKWLRGVVLKCCIDISSSLLCGRRNFDVLYISTILRFITFHELQNNNISGNRLALLLKCVITEHVTNLK